MASYVFVFTSGLRRFQVVASNVFVFTSELRRLQVVASYVFCSHRVTSASGRGVVHVRVHVGLRRLAGRDVICVCVHVGVTSASERRCVVKSNLRVNRTLAKHFQCKKILACQSRRLFRLMFYEPDETKAERASVLAS